MVVSNADSKKFIQSGVTISLIEMLCSIPDVLLLTPVLRTLGNIVTGTDTQTAAMLDQVVSFTKLRLINEIGSSLPIPNFAASP